MRGSPVSDDGQLGPGRPLSDHEQRRLDDISSWLDLTDARFGARMRRFGPHPSPSTEASPSIWSPRGEREHRADRDHRATGATGAPRSRPAGHRPRPGLREVPRAGLSIRAGTVWCASWPGWHSC
jgi:hypothetical protein